MDLLRRIDRIPAAHVRGYSLWQFALIPLGWLIAFALIPFDLWKGDY